MLGKENGSHSHHQTKPVVNGGDFFNTQPYWRRRQKLDADELMDVSPEEASEKIARWVHQQAEKATGRKMLRQEDLMKVRPEEASRRIRRWIDTLG